MFLATCICSDETCGAEVEIVVSHELAAVDATLCACGCTLVLLSVSGWERPPLRVPALVAA